MSPERSLHRSQLSASNSKPYVRSKMHTILSSGSPILPDYATTASHSSDIAPDTFTTQHVERVERQGFPTYAQYKQIETNYIESLTPRRQGKALISQSMFDRIWDVLHHPESQMETAQFRFWARKMFTVNKDYRITLGVPEGMQSPPQEVLLHDNLLVAIQEQLYDLLCYCHASTGHGGRDKTCALIRKHYTWVPKDLVSNFIKACPTCIMKKCGNVGVNSSTIPQLMAEADRMSARLISQQSESALSASSSVSRGHQGRRSPFGKVAGGSVQVAFQETTNHTGSPELSWGTMGRVDHNSGHLHGRSAHDSTASSGYAMHHRHTSSGGNVHSGDENSFPTTTTHPMVREVSLYRGIPNGWQYRHDDFETAHNEFMEYRKTWNDGGSLGDDLDPALGNMRPRIPSIAGMWTPDQFRGAPKEEDMEDMDSMMYGGDHGHNSHLHAAAESHQHQRQHQHQLILPSLASPHLDDDRYMGETDPALLGLSGSDSLSLMAHDTQDAAAGSPHGASNHDAHDPAAVRSHHHNHHNHHLSMSGLRVDSSHSLADHTHGHFDAHLDPYMDHALAASPSFHRPGAPAHLDLEFIAGVDAAASSQKGGEYQSLSLNYTQAGAAGGSGGRGGGRLDVEAWAHTHASTVSMGSAPSGLSQTSASAAGGGGGGGGGGTAAVTSGSGEQKRTSSAGSYGSAQLSPFSPTSGSVASNDSPATSVATSPTGEAGKLKGMLGLKEILLGDADIMIQGAGAAGRGAEDIDVAEDGETVGDVDSNYGQHDVYAY